MSTSKHVAGICLIAGLALVATVACCTTTAPALPDYAAELEPMAKSFISVWGSKDYDQLDAIAAADFRRTAPDQNVNGLVEMKTFMGQVHTAYPDFHIVIDESHVVKDLATMIWTVTGTNTGEGAFPPTGKSIRVQGMTMLRFAGGKIVEEVVFYDTATITEQLGLGAVPHAAQ